MQDNQREEGLELAYLAGVFDGEGTICIQKDNRPLYKNNGKNWNPIYNVTFRVGMTDEQTIRDFKEFFKVGFIDCEKSYHSFRPMWRYSIRRRNDAEMVIRKICPFLRTKQSQAFLAICYFDECKTQRGRYMTEEMLNLKESYFLEMKKLNGIDISNYSPATTKRMGRPKSIRMQAIV